MLFKLYMISLLLISNLSLADPLPNTGIEIGGASQNTRTLPALALTFEGLVLAIPTFFVTTTIHEGSHALVVWLNGGDITRFRPWPSSVDGQFYFGYTEWEGTLSNRALALSSIAPKLMDTAILAAYTAIIETDANPNTQQGKLILAVVAAGAWVDLVHDLFSNDPNNDMTKFREAVGIDTRGERAGFYAIWSAIALGGGIEISRGLFQAFRHTGRRRTRESRNHVIAAPPYLGYRRIF